MGGQKAPSLILKKWKNYKIMDIIKPRIMKGTRDFLPEDMYIRDKVMEIIKGHFTRYGFRPLATPAMEYYDVLTGKYGEEGEGLIFDMAYKGGKEVALKYDLTVPMCRVIAQYRDKIVLPFKRYQIQPVWRAEKPQKGRLREFYQCDADIVGVKEVSADVEIIALITDIIEEIGFTQYKTFLNHRKLLTGLMEYVGVSAEDIPAAIRILDKIDKVGVEKVMAEFIDSGYKKGVVEEMFRLTETTDDPIKDLKRLENSLKGGTGAESAPEAINDLKEIFRLLKEIGISEDKVIFSPRLARGLAYYTGAVFETVVEEPKIGSIAGGGRYDTLIGLFTGVDVPATGMALGLERIVQVIQELGMMEDATGSVDVLICPFGPEDVGASLKIARKIRKAGVSTDVYTSDRRMKKKLKYADRLGVEKVLIIAPEETAKGMVRLKDMESGDEVEVESDGIVEEVLAHLNTKK